MAPGKRGQDTPRGTFYVNRRQRRDLLRVQQRTNAIRNLLHQQRTRLPWATQRMTQRVVFVS